MKYIGTAAVQVSTAVPEQAKTKPLWRELANCSSAAARELVPYEIAARLQMLPVALLEENGQSLMTALFAAPERPEILREARFVAGVSIVPEWSESADIPRAIRAAYCGAEDRLRSAAERAASEQVAGARVAVSSEASGPIPELLDSILERAFAVGASDLHLEPYCGGARLRFRVDGRLRGEPGLTVSFAAYQAVIRRVHVLCGFSHDAQAAPRDGSYTGDFAGQSVRVRVSLLPCHGGEKLVVRLPLRQPADAENALGVEQRQLLLHCLAVDRGLVLLSGPTGSGKSTLLYRIVQTLNSEERNIITLEDPVEQVIDGVVQVEMSSRGGRAPHELLRRIVRQDPDILLVGELRDAGTVELALEAALSGCLCLATVHASSALQCLTRLVHLGAKPAILVEALAVLSSQRLLALNCPHCSMQERPSRRIARLFAVGDQQRLARGVGCEFCRQSGTQGRVSVHEVLRCDGPFRSRLRTLVASAPDGSPLSFELLERTAAEFGFQPLALRVREALLEGRVSPKEALRALGAAPELADI
ncbi:MAG: Flp pilus assembly complex ATPase component TadA [Bdellovibrionales bacterium]|nr:Flp pilus assembly complex ATPase component TadA [Bdellovibrionales bacterium]